MKRLVPTKYVMCALLMLGGLLAVGGTAHAQTITGGSSFDTAATLTAGSFTGGALAGESAQYFSITASQGQLITVTTTFNNSVSSYGTMSTMVLYSQNREELVNKFEANYSSATLTDAWLVNSSTPTSNYYLKLSSDDQGVTSYSMTVTLDNKFDAGSTVDAPSTFENAVTLPAGTSVGHLGGGFEIGNDATDMFVFTPTATGTYQIKLTPAAEAQMILTVYDAQRQQVDQQYSANAGAITTSTFTADQNSPVFVKVECDANCSSKLADYTIALTAPTNSNTNTTVVNTNANANTGVTTNTNATSNTNSNSAIGTTTGKTDKDDKGLSTTMLLIIGGGVIVVLLIVIIIIMARKKKSATPTTPTTPPTPAAPTTTEKK